MRRTRLMLAGFGALVTIASACSLDETSGLSQNLGEPLLDINLGPSGDAVMPTASYTLTSAASRDTMTITLRNLGPLPTGAVYQVFLVDSTQADNASATNLTPVSGRLIRQTRTRRPIDRDNATTDTRTDTTASAQAITAADTNQTFTLRVVNTRIATSTHVVVAVQPAAQTAASRLERGTLFGFLAARYRSGTTFTNTGTLTFGRWTINSAGRLPFVPSSATISGAFRGSTVRLNVRDLIRPPQGFRYAAWVIDSRTGRAARIGGLLTPVPGNRSLDDADVMTDEYLTDVAVIEGQIRGDTATSGNVRWDDFTSIVLLLEPKGSAPPTRPGAAFVLGGQVPASVAGRAPSAGKLSGTVTKTSGGSAAGATVFLTGMDDRIPRLVANANAAGAFLFRTVTPGMYRAFAVPVGGSAPTDSATVTIGTRVVDGVTMGDSVSVTLRIP